MTLHYAFGWDLERIGPAALRIAYDRITLATALARTVEPGNLLPAPGSVVWFEPADPTTITSGQADPAGGTDAWLVEDPGPGLGRARTVAAPAVTPTHEHWISCFIKKNATATHTVRILAQAEGSDSAAVVRIDTGEMASITPDNPAREMTSIELNGWWLFAFKFTADAITTSVPFNVYPAFGTTAGFPALDLAATGSVTIYGPRIADATADPAAGPTRPETIDVRLDTGTFLHLSPPSEVTHEVFADALAAAINATAGVHGTHAVSFDPASGYELSLDEQFELQFSTVPTPAEGTRMREILGLSGDAEAPAAPFTITSDVRPHFFIVPAIQGRTAVSDEYEPDDVVSEDVTDGGETDEISREVDEVWLDWEQTGEDPGELPTEPFDPGTPVYERHETAAVPWSYQRAWTHHQRGFDPIVVTEGTEVTAHRLRAEGAAFGPTRMASDYDMWAIPLRTRLLGRT